MNPVLVEVTRGNTVESVHHGAIAVVDANGKTVVEIGDIDVPVFPRSAIKGLQAIPLVESGAVDKFNLPLEALAIACASHNGEQRHVDTAAAMLSAAGLNEDAYECGVHWPKRVEDHAHLHAAGGPGQLHNNCSGKHAGFLCASVALGLDTHGYVEESHPLQREVKAVLEAMSGVVHEQDVCGRDGCSIPTYAIPLRNAALAFARFGTGVGLDKSRATAAKRIRKAVAAAPFMVAGTGRFCTSVMDLFGERAFVKVGAEGVFCASLPELGLGVALKCSDGGVRAAEVLMAAVLAAKLSSTEAEEASLTPHLLQKLENWRGFHVGDVRLSDGVMYQLRNS
ncbi:MAG: asparaginase [Hyphomicrobiales bacterium]|nr:MAG: asparaginase [Hyphomicrobiales bacterium]